MDPRLRHASAGDRGVGNQRQAFSVQSSATARISHWCRCPQGVTVSSGQPPKIGWPSEFECSKDCARKQSVNRAQSSTRRIRARQKGRHAEA